MVPRSIVVDASGYAARPSRRFGVPIATRVYGIGFEEELEAPAYDQDEAVLRMEAQQIRHSKDDVGRSAKPQPWDVDGLIGRGEETHALEAARLTQ